MNNRPPISSSPSSSINSFRKRRQRGGPKNIIPIIAGILVLGGVILLIVWLSGPGKPINALFATETPTPTMTYTPTNTSTPTATVTSTETATITPTATFSTPFNYTVEANDSLFVIVEKFNLGDDGIQLILLLNPYNPEDPVNEAGYPKGIDPLTQNILPGQIILLPNPGMQLPTPTLIPAGLAQGTKLEYTVKAGDSLGAIAALYNSTIDDIIAENKLTDPNAIKVGDLLIVPVNMVTPTATRPPTSTPDPNAATPTWTPINFQPATSTP